MSRQFTEEELREIREAQSAWREGAEAQRCAEADVEARLRQLRAQEEAKLATARAEAQGPV